MANGANQFGPIIKAVRVRRGLSIPQAASRAGLSVLKWARLEAITGTRTPRAILAELTKLGLAEKPLLSTFKR